MKVRGIAAARSVVEDKLTRCNNMLFQQKVFASADATRAFRSPWTFGA